MISNRYKSKGNALFRIMKKERIKKKRSEKHKLENEEVNEMKK